LWYLSDRHRNDSVPCRTPLLFVTGEISHGSKEQAICLYSVLPFHAIVGDLYFGTKGVVKLHVAAGYGIQKDTCLVLPP